MTFSTLQTLSNNQVVASPMPFDGAANDDISVANRLAEEYKSAGLDPAMAYDDPETALRDFDLKQFNL